MKSTKAYNIMLGGIILLAMLLIAGCKDKAAATDTPPIQGATVAVPKAAEPVRVIREVYILGKEGFSPEEVIIRRNEEVRWVNKDPRKKIVTLTFQKDKSRTFMASGLIDPEDTFVQRFEDAGRYEYWTVEYGVKGKVTVR